MARKKVQNWLNAPNVSWAWALSAAALWALVVLLLAQSQFGEDITNKAARPFEFRVRDALGRTPSLNPRIKVFGMDDKAVAYLGAPSPTIEQWASLLEAFATQEPKMIFIDGMFSISAMPPGREKDVEEAFERIRRLKVPVVVGSFVSPARIPGREEISTDAPVFDLRRMIDRNDRAPNALSAKLRLPGGYGTYLYGPDERVRHLFTHVGHIIYKGDSSFAPFIRLTDTKVVPHLMMYAASKRRISMGSVFIGSARVPTLADGSVPLNFMPFSQAIRAVKSLRPVMKAIGDNETLKGVSRGDYVYIIPPFYTGNTDFKMTPYGPMPGGMIHLFVLNSILNNEWLRPLNAEFILIILGSLLGVAMAVWLRPLAIGLALLAMSLLWVAGSLYLFTYKGIQLTWIFPLMAFMGAAVSVSLEKLRVGEKKSQFIRNALHGSVSEGELQSLARNPQQISFEARERVVTIMFIDIVGFSLVAENQLPRMVFEYLKHTFAAITKLVHGYGGIVNKNLGDGLLCFFGYSLERDETTLDHAEKAVNCALEIQRNNLRATILAFENKQPVYPLRIGINTATVYLGNLGTDQKIDFTVVGNGVNFAKRLEGASDLHSILMSATTKSLVAPLALDDGMERRFVQIKHHSELVPAYSLDPFTKEPELKAKALEIYQLSARQARIKKRWNLEYAERVLVQTNVGAARVANFSLTGMSLQLSVPLSQGTIIRAQFDSLDGGLRSELAERGITAVELEVRWHFQEGETYVHGLKFKELDELNVQFLAQRLQHYGGSAPESQTETSSYQASQAS